MPSRDVAKERNSLLPPLAYLVGSSLRFTSESYIECSASSERPAREAMARRDALILASSRSRSPPRSRSGGADRFPEAKAAGVVLWTEEGTLLIGYQPQKRKWSAEGASASRAGSTSQASPSELASQLASSENYAKRPSSLSARGTWNTGQAATNTSLGQRASGDASG